jgi:hypothetical protein
VPCLAHTLLISRAVFASAELAWLCFLFFSAIHI